MGESTKAVSALIMLGGALATVFAWYADRPEMLTWAFRFGSPLAAILSLLLILKLHYRADLARDYLRELVGSYFNRDGFCFNFGVSQQQNIACLDAYFQNQRDVPCVGRIALRPARGFFMRRASIDPIAYEIDCPPAAFGVAQVAISIPEKLQGKRQAFEVGASVEYRQGKGRLLRFHDGIHLRTNSEFGDKFCTAVTIAGAAGGTIVLSKPAKLTLNLPTGVSDAISPGDAPQVTILWQLGDPPLNKVA
jgi:hypothetical protein